MPLVLSRPVEVFCVYSDQGDEGCFGYFLEALGLLLGTEAPVITPNGVDFSFLFYLLEGALWSKHLG